MAAAPHLFDDASIASPELALVDADLAAQLRADMSTGEAFRPRDAVRPELTLVFEAVVRDLAEDEPSVQDEPLAEPEPPEEDPVVEELDDAPVAAWPALPDLVVPSADPVDADPGHESLPDAADDPEVEPESDAAAAEADALASEPEAAAPPALEAPSELPEHAFELPDYIVVNDDDPDVLPDYVVEPANEVAPFVPDVLAPAVEEPVEDALPDYLVHEDELAPDLAGEAEDGDARSAYPVLPDLDERSDALEETEAALRRIREQLVVPPSAPRRRPRVRRRFTVAAGLCAVAAAAAFAAEVQLGVLHAPGFIAF